jgi:tetratricopeptide (TPR) repeat protein
MSSAPSLVAAEFQQAVSFLQRGQLARARASCRNLLSKQPDHFDALHLMGLIALNAGDAVEAVDLITRAIEIFPGNAAAFSNRGSALQQLAEFGRALTSVAHLSAALGRPTWVMLAFNADWPWLLGRDDSPWYPTARLYRQEKMNEWGGPLAMMGADLVKVYSPSSTPPNS